jgi:hypothetical protein
MRTTFGTVMSPLLSPSKISICLTPFKEQPDLQANLRLYPYEFYQKQGYVIVGAIPDVNGFGKPDILMAKRVDRG